MQLSRRHIPFLIIFAAFLVVFFWGLNLGDLGHDYNYYFPKLLDGKWHFLRRGFAPFWYTAHFCGGFPEYGNPESVYYSLLQFLVLFLDLWLATQIAMAVFMIAGYVGWYLFGRDVLRLPLHFAHVLALIVIAHGFHLMHMMAGHVSYQPIPLLGLLLWLLFERRSNTPRLLLLRSCAFALVSAIALYAGGYMVGVLGLMVFFLFLPIELAVHTGTPRMRRFRDILLRSVYCGAAALALAASKLVAVWSLMRFFPHIMESMKSPEGASGLLYMFKAFWAVPQNEALFVSFGMPDWGAIHEYSMYVSPVVLLGLLCGVSLLATHWSVLRRHWKIMLGIAVYCLVLIAFFAGLSRGHGMVITPFLNLPFFRSFDVTTRFLFAFSLLPIGAGVWCAARYVKEHAKFRSMGEWIARGASLLTLLAFTAAYGPLLLQNAPPRSFEYDRLLFFLRENPRFLDLQVTQIIDIQGRGHAGFMPLLGGSNLVSCFESILWGSEKPAMPPLTPGPMHFTKAGESNLYNPACFQYPEAIRCKPGDRIARDDIENFERFLGGEKTTWKMSWLQHAANWLSLLTLFLCVGILAKEWIRRLHHH